MCAGICRGGGRPEKYREACTFVSNAAKLELVPSMTKGRGSETGGRTELGFHLCAVLRWETREGQSCCQEKVEKV